MEQPRRTAFGEVSPNLPLPSADAAAAEKESKSNRRLSRGFAAVASPQLSSATPQVSGSALSESVARARAAALASAAARAARGARGDRGEHGRARGELRGLLSGRELRPGRAAPAEGARAREERGEDEKGEHGVR